MVWIIRLEMHCVFGKYAHSIGIENGDLNLIFMYDLIDFYFSFFYR